MRLILFVLFAVLVISNAKAAECNMEPPAAMVELLQSHPMIVAAKVLTAPETARGLQPIPDKPDDADITEGVMALRTDGALLILAWTKDGGCGHAIIPPHLTEQIMRAIQGTPA